jgi:hypothetical protein
VQRAAKPVVFLVGSPITAPVGNDDPGVPGVEGVIALIRQEFSDPEQLVELEKALKGAANRYQAAFAFLLGRRGQQAANQIIKRAVWKARKPVSESDLAASYSPSASTTDESCKLLDSDYDGWLLTAAAESLGRLVALYPDRFGKEVLTTNFDPLIEVAIGKSGGHFFRTVLHRDGNLGQTAGTGCHVIHLHGYWYGADTLTPLDNSTNPALD